MRFKTNKLVRLFVDLIELVWSRPTPKNANGQLPVDSMTGRTAISPKAWASYVREISMAILLLGSGVTQATGLISPTADFSSKQVLVGNVHPAANAANFVGPVDPVLPMERILLLLKGSADQQAAMVLFLSDQQDPTSPDYHNWLTPEQFGARFGPQPSDIAVVVSWLTAQGFRVNEIAKSGLWIDFSGSVSSVQSTFQTGINQYLIDGQMRLANAQDPTIPAALAAVVVGPVSLNNIPRRSSSVVVQPEYSSGSNHYLAPGDFAAIYNLNPLYAAGVDGTGQSIAVIGRTHPSSINWANFRSTFQLPNNPPQVVVNGADPGDLGSGEDGEADLDVEWSGAVAKGATIKFVTSSSTATTDGVDLSAAYAVNNNVAPIITASFGNCESHMGASGRAYYNSVWAQAAGQGISVFVSSGDGGAAGCDAYSATTATGGRAVNGLSSTAYNVAVGGTQFNEGLGNYWAGSNASNGSSALGYIPEMAWNESGSVSGGQGLWSTGGGQSAYNSKPAWQVAPGVASDGTRDVPDVSLTAAAHDGYCSVSQGSTYISSGTSASSPAFAGIMALVLQKTGQRQGNPNPRLYQLGNAQFSGQSGAAAVFHDITGGNNTVPGVAGFAATAGYDLVTGLGSVDATALVNNWATTATCIYTLSSSSQSFISSGGTGSVNLTASAGCTWSVVSNATWLTVTSTASGSGSGTVSYSVAANTGNSSRSGTLTVSGQTFTVTQAAAASCSYSLSSSSLSMGATATVGSVNVNTGAGCAWTAVSNASWITITSGSVASGAGSVVFAAAANTSTTQRIGTLTIGGQTLTVTQAAASCTFAIDSTSATVSASVGTGTINVSAASGCAWAAQSGASWITINSGVSGNGSGSVIYSFTSNTSTIARTGTITVAGILYTVTQAGTTACGSPILSGSVMNLPSGGGQIYFGVTSASSCSWTVNSPNNWITVNSGTTSGAGNGTVVATVAANPNTTTRAGVINVSGQIFNVLVDAVNTQRSTSANDNLTGTGGVINTAVYSGMSGEYSVSVSSATGVVTVADTVSGRDGVDSLTNIQRAQFVDNLNLAFDLNSSAGAGGIYRLYAAAFNRKPDLQGIGYWILQSDLGQSMTQIATGFTFSSEFATLYGATISDVYATGANLTNLVTGFYTNVLHRAPDPAGLSYYAGQIASHGKTVGQVLAEISDSAENRTQVAPQIQNGVLFWPWRPDSLNVVVGGIVSGLSQSGLVLSINGNPDPVPGGATSFSQGGVFVYGNRYNVTVINQPAGQSCSVANGVGTVGSSAVTSISINCGAGFALGGSVTGLTTPGLVLSSNSQSIAIPANSTNFTFPSLLPSGTNYKVVVQTQPSGQTCSISNGSGIMGSAAVTNVTIFCSASSQPITLAISGLTSALPAYLYNGSQLVETINLVPGQTTGTFATLVSPGNVGSYLVSIGAQYQGAAGFSLPGSVTQYCKAPGAAGSLVGNNNPVLNSSAQGYVFQFNCVSTYTLQFNVVGLSAVASLKFGFCDTGCWVATAGNTTWSFAAAIDSPSGWSFDFVSSSSGQICSATPSSGPALTLGAIQKVNVVCASNAYSLGGSISQLTTAGLVLQLSSSTGNQSLTVAANATSFGFPAPVAAGASYAVTVSNQPAGSTCSVTNGTGTMPTSNVNNVALLCTANGYTLGGTVSGLPSAIVSNSTVTLASNGQTVVVNGGVGGTPVGFTFPTPLVYGTLYNVTVSAQPSGYSCTVNNGSGAISTTNVSNVVVSCAASQYTLSGSISGLSSQGLVLLNSGQSISIAANATSFTFPSTYASGTTYNVSVQTQPSGQTCTVANGSGVLTSNVSSVSIQCASASSYTVSGIISNLVAGGQLFYATDGASTWSTMNLPSGQQSFSLPGTHALSSAVSFGTFALAVAPSLSVPNGQLCRISGGGAYNYFSGSTYYYAASVGPNSQSFVLSCVSAYELIVTISGLSASNNVSTNGFGFNVSNGIDKTNNTGYLNGTWTFVLGSDNPSWNLGFTSQPQGQTCVGNYSSGVAAASGVYQVSITCQ
jgi:hypothetical protein